MNDTLLRNFLYSSRQWSGVKNELELFTMAGTDLKKFAGVDSGFFVYSKRILANEVVPGELCVFASWGVFHEDLDGLSAVLEKTIDSLSALDGMMGGWLPSYSIHSPWLHQSLARYNILEFGIWPLMSREARVGAIVVARTHEYRRRIKLDPRALVMEDALIDTCAAQISLALELVAALRIAEEASQRDLLTGLLNRRGLEVEFPSLVTRVSELAEKTYLVFCVLDINDLKVVNDTKGHPAGDVALRKVGEIVMRNISSDDLVCRYGGDEFVVVCVSAVPDSVITAMRIQSAVREESA